MRDVGTGSPAGRALALCAAVAALTLALPGSALAGWGAPETVGTDINQVQLLKLNKTGKALVRSGRKKR